MPSEVEEGDAQAVHGANESAHVPAEDVEARTAHAAKIPFKPSAKGIAEHNITHLHYRDWCPICVRACGVSAPHFKDVDRSEHAVPAVCADYCLVCRDPKLEDEADDDDDVVEEPEEDSEREATARKERATILNVKDVLTGCLRPHLVPRKGVAGCSWIAREVAKDLALWGHNNCIFKSDQERSIVAVYNEVAQLHVPYRLIPENSPKGDSQANGVIERGNRSLKNQIRVFLFAREAYLNKKIDLRHNIVAWIIQHAGFVLTHYQVGKDGRTAYERLKGKKMNIELCKLGKKIFYMPLKVGNGLASAEARYKTGVWLGVDEKTSEIFVGTPDGDVVKARSTKRRPDEDRWDAELIQNITGFPWNLSGVGSAPGVTFEEREVGDGEG